MGMSVQIEEMEPHGQSPWLSVKAGEDSNAGQNSYFLLELLGCVLGELNLSDGLSRSYSW